VIERAVLLSKGDTIRDADIGEAFHQKRVGLATRKQIIIDFPQHGVALGRIEQIVVKQVLDMCDWNKSESARLLGISRARLRRILDDAGLDQDRREESV
jgi:DNA-binding NtrC family response regulator